MYVFLVLSWLDTEIILEITSSNHHINDGDVELVRTYIATEVPRVISALVGISEGEIKQICTSRSLPPMRNINAWDGYDEVLAQIKKSVYISRHNAYASLANLSSVQDLNVRASFVHFPRLFLLLVETVHHMLGKNSKENDLPSQQQETKKYTVSRSCAETVREDKILEHIALGLRNFSVVDRMALLCMPSRKRLVQAIVMIIDKDDKSYRSGYAKNACRFSITTVKNLAADDESNAYAISQYGGQRLFAILSQIANSNNDCKTHAASALNALALDNRTAELMAKTSSTILDIAVAATSSNEIVGSNASYALHNMLSFTTGEEFRRVLCQITSCGVSKPNCISSIKHDLIMEYS